MITFILGLVVGLVVGFIFGIFFYAKKVNKRIENDVVTRETINSIVQGEAPKGDFIINNPVQEYIKNHDGEISLGDILEDE